MIAEIREAVIAALGADVRVKAVRFPSGAVSIDIWAGERFVVIQSFPSQGDVWGMSLDVTAETGFLGHDHVFPTLDEALSATRSYLQP